MTDEQIIKALKEFAERLKRRCRRFVEFDEGGWSTDVMAISGEDIDDLVNEMTEE